MILNGLLEKLSILLLVPSSALLLLVLKYQIFVWTNFLYGFLTLVGAKSVNYETFVQIL